MLTDSTTVLQSYGAGAWQPALGESSEIRSAIDGRVVARFARGGTDFEGTVAFARTTGARCLRASTFHERAAILKALATYLDAHKAELYAASFDTGATKHDHLVDIDGGIGTLFAYATRGRRELPGARFVLEGELEPLSKRGSFAGRHILVPRDGIAVHINAYNFPCWGMLEKFAPAFLAGVPSIVKPATATAYVAHALVRLIVASGVVPEGALQLVIGSAGDLLDRLGGQDVISFTGSLETSLKLREHPVVAEKAVRFIAERDSLNAAVLGSDVLEGTPEFDLFVSEVVREMTVKAGQKCTAIRRAIVPRDRYHAVARALASKLAEITVGDPRLEAVRMGPLVSCAQRDDVRARVADLRNETTLLFGDPEHCSVIGADETTGAFLSPILLGCERPLNAQKVHAVEAFGPVSTLMAYDTLDDAIEIVRRGEGSLVASIVTYDSAVATTLVAGIAPYHGRILVLDRDCARESTGHGSPLPALVHGGPGRAGGGEELGGMRGVHHYMQRTAIQGSAALLATLSGTWTHGAPLVEKPAHPFRYRFDELEIGQSLETAQRTVTLEDIEHFAHFTGDTFYAHMDDAAAKANPFFPGRVAHGYLLLSFAAGLFVDPDPGPVLANYGLDTLRFLKPVQPGDSIRVRLTVKAKAPRKPEYGEVRWDVDVTNGNGEAVAAYELLTLNATSSGDAQA
jgi:oxepin-CoA hydrolase/3-oxo-5,6-dehydrosuberyl-CoA semialdehyde dehydrogenase